MDKDSVHSILEYTATDGKTYKTQFYNLDAIISVGKSLMDMGHTLSAAILTGFTPEEVFSMLK